MPTVAVAERFGYTRHMPGPISQDRAAPSAASWRGRDNRLGNTAGAFNSTQLAADRRAQSPSPIVARRRAHDLARLDGTDAGGAATGWHSVRVRNSFSNA
jgi:hypothetical protein